MNSEFFPQDTQVSLTSQGKPLHLLTLVFSLSVAPRVFTDSEVAHHLAIPDTCQEPSIHMFVWLLQSFTRCSTGNTTLIRLTLCSLLFCHVLSAVGGTAIFLVTKAKNWEFILKPSRSQPPWFTEPPEPLHFPSCLVISDLFFNSLALLPSLNSEQQYVFFMGPRWCFTSF